MKRRIDELIQELRAADLPIATGEVEDALRAVAILGVDPLAFKEGLAAALIKDQGDRPVFDQIFARLFRVPASTGRKRSERSASGEGMGGRSDNEGPGLRPARERRSERERVRSRELRRTKLAGQLENDSRPRSLTRRQLSTLPFREMSPNEVEACVELAEELARRFRSRARRRHRIARRDLIDMRRTMRRALGLGGTPIRLVFRTPRPGKPDLVALCDLSHSVAAAAEFFLALLQPARSYFRRVHLFGYVDRPVAVERSSAGLAPAGPIDLFARSDFGRVLGSFWNEDAELLSRNTVVLILGDARNNRRPPRADLLRQMRQRTRRVVWLNPEHPSRWDSGDSAMAAYRPWCDSVVAADTPRQLARVLQRALA